MSRKVSKKITINLLKTLKDASIASAKAGGKPHETVGVQSPFHQAFRTALPKCKIDGLHTCGDGVLRDPEDTGISALLEAKFDLDLKDSFVRSGVIVQILYDFKAMLGRGEFVTAGFGHDVNECFCIRTKALEKYLHREDIDWSLAPSSAAEKNHSLVVEISEDKDIQPYIHDINEKFDFQVVIEELESFSKDKDSIIEVTEKNIAGVYPWFDKNVIKGKRVGEGNVWTIDGDAAPLIADVFYTYFTAPNEIYLDEKRNILTYRGKRIKINRQNYNIFVTRYIAFEVDELIANKDRIFDDIHRRRTGAFFTPQIWADESDKMNAEQLGEDYKEKFTIWGCAAGTGNLTRRWKKFKTLCISTLEPGDIDTIKDRNYNPGAIIFPYDFLSEIGSNGDFATTTGIEGVPDSLQKAFESGEKILFYDNFPFGRAAKGSCPKSAGKNIVNTAMLENKMGGCSAQLYAQFMWKILDLAKQYPNQVYVALFSQSDFMTAPSYRKFRSAWEKSFQFLSGILFDAGNFSDISSGWGISFTIWGPKKVGDSNNKRILKLKEVNAEGKIEITGTKEMYNADRNACSSWIREETKSKKFSKLFGYFDIGRNNVRSNSRNVYLYSEMNDQVSLYGEEKIMQVPSPIPIILTNFRKVSTLFAARRLIKVTWKNDVDEYLIPNTSHPDYPQWVNDTIIYTLFEIAARQSAFRKFLYKNKLWDIKNELFFMSNKEMRELAENSGFNELIQDTARFPKDRYINNLLQTISLSDDAKQVLEMARDLVRKSMKKREEYHYDNDRYHLNAWDAGWAQLKPMLKKYYKEEYDEFVTAYKQFEDRMREGVYEFGFLRR